MSWTVNIHRKALKSLADINKKDQNRIREAIDSLESDSHPFGVRKIVGSDSMYRIRIGNYRVVYEVQNQQLSILVVDIGHRREVYRNH